jgi:hypothetical protein
MKHIDNDVASINCSEDLHEVISRFCVIVRNNPSVLRPVKDYDEDVRQILSSEGFTLYPTVKTTTLFYDPGTDCFFKTIHPLSLKHRVVYYCLNKAASLFGLSEEMRVKGVKTQGVAAFGFLKMGRRPFYASPRVEGESLFDVLIKKKQKITIDEYQKVIDEIIKLHKTGYWLGDAHLAHVFMKNGEVSGLIDIDSIRKNRPCQLKNIAKDLAGLNHPELPLSKEQKSSLLHYYMEKAGIEGNKKFPELITYYTDRRWKD